MAASRAREGTPARATKENGKRKRVGGPPPSMYHSASDATQEGGKRCGRRSDEEGSENGGNDGGAEDVEEEGEKDGDEGANNCNPVMSGEEMYVDEATTPVSTTGIPSAAIQELFPGASVDDAVIEVVCRAAALSCRLSGDNRCFQGDKMDEEAFSIADEATALVTRYVAVLFGALNTPKIHERAAHLLAHFRGHGNITDADTSVNETFHAL